MNTPKIIEQQEKNQEAFDYFLSFRMDELKSDDQYYLNAMKDYIESLEAMIFSPRPIRAEAINR